MKWFRKEKAEGPTPDLRVTFRYMTSGAGASVSTTYQGRTATSLMDGVENDRRGDKMVSLGSADAEGNEIVSFPARSIVDIKIALAEEGK